MRECMNSVLFLESVYYVYEYVRQTMVGVFILKESRHEIKRELSKDCPCNFHGERSSWSCMTVL